MSPREYRLYHYTSRADYLSDILRSGFWPRYCAEDFSWIDNGRPLYLMIPMVCFCDIPIGLSANHKKAYGNYTIGMSKDWGKDIGSCPLLYIYTGSPLATHLSKIGRKVHAGDFSQEKLGDYAYFLPYLKPVTGYFPDGKHAGPRYTETKDFDEEMEWRYVPADLIGTIYSEQLFGGGAEIKRRKLNESTKGMRLKFKPEHVEQIIVQSKGEREAILREFPYYKDRICLWNEIELFGS